MKQEDGWGILGPFVEIMHLPGEAFAQVDGDPVFGEWIIGNIGETRKVGLKNLHRNRLLPLAQMGSMKKPIG